MTSETETHKPGSLRGRMSEQRDRALDLLSMAKEDESIRADYTEDEWQDSVIELGQMVLELTEENRRPLPSGTNLITVTVDGDTEQSFVGRWLVRPAEYQLGVAVTSKGRIAVLAPHLFHPKRSKLLDLDDLNEAMKVIKAIFESQIEYAGDDPVLRDI
jgi:hypothetical protein